MQSIYPQWVLVDGGICHVSDFKEFKKRPIAYCLVCGKRVVLKLGQERVHHYAHAANDICAVTQPETALHFNLKYHLYNELKHANAIYVEQNCRGFCGTKFRFLWVSNWDEVRVEQAVGSLRADVGLLFQGEVIGVIEVKVTHAVDPIKKQYYMDRNITWLEITAQESLYQGENRWIAAQPLPWYQLHPPLEAKECEQCVARKKKAKSEAEYKAKNNTTIHAGMMVDFYFPSGKKYREVLYIMKQISRGIWVKAWVKNENNKIIATVLGRPITQEILNQLTPEIDEYLENCKKGSRTIMDRVKPWRKWLPGSKFFARDIDRNPFNYDWSDEEQKWIKRANLNDWIMGEDEA